MPVEANQDDMLTIGLNCVGYHPARTIGHSEATNLKHFVRFFGVDPIVCSIVFRDIQVQDIGEYRISKPKVSYFLMTLYWLKCYPLEHQTAGLFGYDEDTVRRWVWSYCSAIQALKAYKVRYQAFSMYKMIFCFSDINPFVILAINRLSGRMLI
jgi:hypothetical protein